MKQLRWGEKYDKPPKADIKVNRLAEITMCEQSTDNTQILMKLSGLALAEEKRMPQAMSLIVHTF